MRDGAGELYAFTTKYSPDESTCIVKVGRTKNWNKRKKHYIVGNAPDVILLRRHVKHVIRGETTIITYCTKRYTLYHGNEFFSVPRKELKELKDALNELVDRLE